MAMGGDNGVLTIDKPAGCTSHDVVARVRQALRLRAVGHAGTLDPMATGVLVVLVGEGTKLAPWLTAQDKMYEATVSLGTETDTLDADGRETRRTELSPELRDALRQSRPLAIAPLLEAAFDVERQRTSQIPPAYSAIQIGGERAHAMARRGDAPTLIAREVGVRRLELVACGEAPAQCTVSLEVSKGYYVRAFARDLSGTLGVAGHLTSLRRIRSGRFGLEGSLSPDASADAMRARLEPIASAAVRALPVGRLTPSGAEDARHGRRVQRDAIAAPGAGPCAWLDPQGDLVAVGELDGDGVGRVLRGFSPTSRERPCEPLLERP
jgi:tRNA pseudouridine55 synthase